MLDLKSATLLGSSAVANFKSKGTSPQTDETWVGLPYLPTLGAREGGRRAETVLLNFTHQRQLHRFKRSRGRTPTPFLTAWRPFRRVDRRRRM